MGHVQRYQKRISGPLMDRIDIHLEVVCVPFEKLSCLDGGEPSSTIRARVEAARAVQAERFAPLGKPHVLVNGDMGPYNAAFEQRRIERYAALLPDRRGLIVQVARVSCARPCARRI